MVFDETGEKDLDEASWGIPVGYAPMNASRWGDRPTMREVGRG